MDGFISGTGDIIPNTIININIATIIGVKYFPNMLSALFLFITKINAKAKKILLVKIALVPKNG